MASPKVMAIVLAGGEGKRLMPLTADRAKPAVPFGGVYRLVDFALSNLVNARYLRIVVLTQYKSHSLDRHISQGWRMSNLLGNYIAPVPAQQRVGKRWYLGSADAIFQSLNLVRDERPDVIVVVGADHGGVGMKDAVLGALRARGHAVEDVGTFGTDAVDYPDFALAVARAVASGRADVGIMVDGAGIGSCMVANKVPGVRAAMCHDVTTATNAREHNNANVLTLGGTLLGPRLALEVVQAFLDTTFAGGRHERRVQKIDALDAPGR